MKDGILSLLERYTTAFDAADADGITECYHAPCLTIRADGSFHLFEDRDSIGQFFANVVKTYHDEGMESGTYSNLEIHPIGTKCALATMDWKMQRADGSVIREWRQSYNVMELDGTCVFYVSTFHT